MNSCNDKRDELIEEEITAEQVNPKLNQPLVELFSELSKKGYERTFHPHPFTPEQADLLANYSGSDYYAVLLAKGQILAYGMLRGWDEGFAIPRLGIATHPDFRGRGAGRKLMLHLHEVAKLRDAPEVQLTVDRDNEVAISLYRSLGYILEGLDEKRLLGRLSL